MRAREYMSDKTAEIKRRSLAEQNDGFWRFVEQLKTQSAHKKSTATPKSTNPERQSSRNRATADNSKIADGTKFSFIRQISKMLLIAGGKNKPFEGCFSSTIVMLKILTPHKQYFHHNIIPPKRKIVNENQMTMF